MTEVNPEVQAQIEEQKKNCPFCKIVKGEIEAKNVYSDNIMKGVLDINPWVKGHVLLLPKEHFAIMPLLPPETFKHMFGLMPKLVKAVKDAMLCTGANVFIANGGVAGQQSPHFLLHIIPRDGTDYLDKFMLDSKKDIEEEKLTQVNSMLANNLPQMMKNHFGRSPPSWKPGDIKNPEFFKNIKFKQKVYEDAKVLCVVPENPQCIGHLVVYSQEEESLFENLDKESAAHMFYCASYCATASFEGLKAHGSNIILKTGASMDNESGMLSIHILPRFQGDDVDVIPKPMEKKPDLDEVKSKIREHTFVVEKSFEQKEDVVINLDHEREVIDLSNKKQNAETKQKPKNAWDEISSAIEDIKRK